MFEAKTQHKNYFWYTIGCAALQWTALYQIKLMHPFYEMNEKFAWWLIFSANYIRPSPCPFNQLTLSDTIWAKSSAIFSFGSNCDHLRSSYRQFRVSTSARDNSQARLPQSTESILSQSTFPPILPSIWSTSSGAFSSRFVAATLPTTLFSYIRSDRLQFVPRFLVPLTGKYESVFSAAPVAIGVPVAFEGDEKPIPYHSVDSGWTQQHRVLLVDRFESLAHLEDVVDRLDGFLHEDVLRSRFTLLDDRLELLLDPSRPRA